MRRSHRHLPIGILQCGQLRSECRMRKFGPAVRAVLGTLARDEARHAVHAWRTVAWALATFGEAAREAIRSEIAALEA